MNSQSFWHIFFKFFWILFFHLHSVYSQMDSPTLYLEPKVSVIFTGEDLTFHLSPANESTTLTCSDPSNTQILINAYHQTGTDELKWVLKNLTISGEYYCKYQNTKVYWFLCVRDPLYGETKKDNTEVVIVAVLTGVLLVFSVVGSVYVFRGHLQISKCGKTGRKEKQKKEEGKNTEIEDGNAYIRTAPSTSVYASLEPRTKSIYDELDCSAACKNSDPQRPKPRNKEANKTKLQSTQHQDEGQFECVYENY